MHQNLPTATDAPTLYLHIGRNKAGSTTLQNHWVTHADALRQAGIDYVLFGQPSPPGSELLTFPSHRLIADFARGQRGRSVLVSHEVISCFPPEVTRNMAADLSDLNVRVIFYVRPYRDWVLSSYNFDVRTGFNKRDFDSYLQNIQPTISFWPMLEVWGEAIGWQNVRVRSLHPRDLQGRDLIGDSDAALGVTLPPSNLDDRVNTSPSWMVIELLRTIVDREPSGGWNRTGLAVAEALHGYTDAAIEACGATASRVTYLTPRQARGLQDLYNRDLAAIAARTGLPLQPDDIEQPPDRAFLPTAAEVPKNVMRTILEQALETDAARLHPEAATFVATALFGELCAR
jgi:hypothetical protein